MFVCALALTASACRADNPEFDAPAVASGSSEESATDPTDPTDPTDSTDSTDPTDPTDPDPTDPDPTDPDPTDSTDSTEPTDPDPSDTDPVLDLIEEPAECFVTPSEGLTPYFGSTEIFGGGCPEGEGGGSFSSFVRRVDAQDGDWIVQPCGPECIECNPNQPIPVGAPGLEINNLIPQNPEQGNQLDNCYFVEFEWLIEDSPEACVYGSMAIFDPSDINTFTPVFVAVREAYPMPFTAELALPDFDPYFDLQQHEFCGCDVAAADYCCEQIGVETFAYFADALPGQIKEIGAGGQSYDFHARQAQTGVHCEPYDEFSWAMVRQPEP